ncbi:hypothetical protein ACFQ0B_53445 [Nonomuraea thailandensis]
MLQVTPSALTADFKILRYVSRPGAPAEKGATLVLPDRGQGLTSST